MPIFATALATFAILMLFQPTVRFLSMLHHLRKYRLILPSFRLGKEGSLTTPFLSLAKPLVEALAEAGFAPEAPILGNSERMGTSPLDGILLGKTNDPTKAMIGWEAWGDHTPTISFLTPLADGQIPTTMVGHPAEQDIPQGTLGIRRLPYHDPRILLEEHSRRIRLAVEQGAHPVQTTPTDFVARLEAARRSPLQAMVDSGRAEIEPTGGLRMPWTFDLRSAWRLVSHRKEIGAIPVDSGLAPEILGRLRSFAPPTVAPVERPGTPWNWTILSLLLFALVQGVRMGWQFVPLFLSILAFHEAGHLLAMRIFGYRDVKVFFIPFLGALATADGKPWGMSPWKSAIVSIAGPLPGILAGCALVVGMSSLVQIHPWFSLLATAIPILLMLNLFNLLPLGDLDGGQFLQAVLFTRMPRAEVFFRLSGSLTLGVLALRFHMPLIAAFSVLPLFSIRTVWDAARVRGALHDEAASEGMPADRKTALSRVDRILAQAPFDEIPSPRRDHIRGIVVRDLDPTPMPVWQSTLFLALYLVLWAPALLLYFGRIF